MPEGTSVHFAPSAVSYSHEAILGYVNSAPSATKRDVYVPAGNHGPGPETRDPFIDRLAVMLQESERGPFPVRSTVPLQDGSRHNDNRPALVSLETYALSNNMQGHSPLRDLPWRQCINDPRATI